MFVSDNFPRKDVTGSLHAAAPQAEHALAIEDELVALHARLTQTQAQIFARIAALDASEAWRTDGATSMEHWLRMRLGVGEATARDWVEASRSLQELPAIRSKFAGAELCWDQVRPLSKFASAEDDLRLANEAGGWSPAALEDEVRRRRRITREEAAVTYEDRYIKKRWNRDKSSLHVWGELPHDLGAKVEKALERMAHEAFRLGVKEPVKARYADALGELCSIKLGADTSPDRATVVIHVTRAEFEARDGIGELDNGVLLASETLRRLACNGAMQMVAESVDGGPIGVGRKCRIVPQWLARQVRYRDGGCRWPDCGRDGWVDVHHIKHWCHGGRTDLDNLVLLCGYHHTLVHELGFRIYGDPNEELRFFRPDQIPIGSTWPVSRRL